jgi:hypothetical protein
VYLARSPLPGFDSPATQTIRILAVARYLESSSRFVLAQSLSAATAFNGGPPVVPHAHGPSIFASVMHEHDFVFKQAHT